MLTDQRLAAAKPWLFAAGALACTAILALAFTGRPWGKSLAHPPLRESAADAGGTFDLGAVELEPRAQSPVPAPPSEGEPASAAGSGDRPVPPETPGSVGTVVGVVTDFEGTGIAHAELKLAEAESLAWSRGHRSDLHGEFRFEAVPVGSYRLLMNGSSPPVFEAMLTELAAFEVTAGAETFVPVALEGKRSLSGRVLMQGEADALGGSETLHLELRAVWDPHRTIAEADVTTWRTPPWEQADLEPTQADLWDMGFHDLESFQAAQDAWREENPEEAPWQVGSFRFEHLTAGRYTLRISPAPSETVALTIEGERFETRLYTERTVDLTYDSVVLPLEEFSFNRMLQAAVDRDGLIPAKAPTDD